MLSLASPVVVRARSLSGCFLGRKQTPLRGGNWHKPANKDGRIRRASRLVFSDLLVD